MTLPQSYLFIQFHNRLLLTKKKKEKDVKVDDQLCLFFIFVLFCFVLLLEMLFKKQSLQFVRISLLDTEVKVWEFLRKSAMWRTRFDSAVARGKRKGKIPAYCYDYDDH